MAVVGYEADSVFRVLAIPPGVLARVRATGYDDFGNATSIQQDDEGGAPLRCCLRHSQPGERLALMAYRPFQWSGPYAEVGPVFVHADPCPGYNAPEFYPEDFRPRRQILRAYGPERNIVDAVITEGADAEHTIGALLARPEVDFIHSRNVAYGCFMFEIRRP